MALSSGQVVSICKDLEQRCRSSHPSQNLPAIPGETMRPLQHLQQPHSRKCHSNKMALVMVANPRLCVAAPCYNMACCMDAHFFLWVWQNKASPAEPSSVAWYRVRTSCAESKGDSMAGTKRCPEADPTVGSPAQDAQQVVRSSQYNAVTTHRLGMQDMRETCQRPSKYPAMIHDTY